MKNKLCLLAVTGIFVATSANAAITVTSSQIQTFSQAVADYLAQNSAAIQSASGMTSADLNLFQSMYGSLATSTQLSTLTNIYNSTLQSSAGCAGIGTYPNINSNNISTCAADLVNALRNHKTIKCTFT